MFDESDIAIQSWLPQQPFISFLARLSQTLRKLTVHGLHKDSSSSDLAQCLQVTPSLTHLDIEGSYNWVTPELVASLTCRGGSACAEACLVPELEELKIVDTHIAAVLWSRMIQSRWGTMEDGYAGARLKSVRFVVRSMYLNFWPQGSDPHERLIKFREEGLDISIIDYYKGEDVLKGPVVP
jgi:hypothetical protein